MAKRTSPSTSAGLLLLTCLLSVFHTTAGAAIAVRSDANGLDALTVSEKRWDTNGIVPENPISNTFQWLPSKVEGSKRPKDYFYHGDVTKCRCVSYSPWHKCRLYRCDDIHKNVTPDGRIPNPNDKRGATPDSAISIQASDTADKVLDLSNPPKIKWNLHNPNPTSQPTYSKGSTRFPPVLGDKPTTPNPCLVKATTSFRGKAVWSKKNGTCDLITLHPLTAIPPLDQIALGYPRRWVLGNTIWGLVARDRLTSQCILVAADEIVPCDGFDFSMLRGRGEPTYPLIPDGKDQIKLTVIATVTASTSSTAFNDGKARKASHAVRIQARSAQSQDEGFTRVTDDGLLTAYRDGMCSIEGGPRVPCYDVKNHKGAERIASQTPSPSQASQRQSQQS
jgi:hypothetical protein